MGERHVEPDGTNGGEQQTDRREGPGVPPVAELDQDERRGEPNDEEPEAQPARILEQSGGDQQRPTEGERAGEEQQ